ncbi:MAG: hypothetical protein P8Y69_02085 [Gammaproteobacteria bacterium]
MSTTPRLDSAIPGRPADLSTVLAHAPRVMDRFGSLYATFWQQGLVGSVLKEMTRIRNARITDCGY